MSVFSLTCLIHILDKMAENMNKESEITSTVEDTWFVNIPEVEIKLENTKIQGNHDKFTLSCIHSASFDLILGKVLNFPFKEL